MIRKIYNFIFAPPFDGFGPLVINVLLIGFIVNFAIKLDPKYTFYIGMLTYPFIVFMRKKLEALSNHKEKNDN